MEQDPDVYAEQAKKLVDDVIETAIKRLETNLSIMSEKEKTFESLKFSEMSRESTLIREDDYVIDNIAWLSIGDYSVQLAEKKIDEFIQTWKYDNSWLYCIDYLGEDEHEFDVRHRFRVRWSVPTRRKPIPRATACVYFTFQVSKIKPKSHPVEVFYVFETNRLVHRPGQSRFREKWLKDVIESKVLMMQAVAF
ncbi:A-kinase anchor protein 14-like isoform X3 [Ruditapes philippinarum]|uniref:A-kinase anchor protein 14-like isoform X3 n=1 Tax=Ruditapes philippinarum TaxID=129788 RepID=UPI00295AADC5|nr:A-kinase anchor protein 14-like isoform X3 [Ruditapes philippinarum]